ncbi:MAG: RNA polymerase sigma factor [Acidimicrobiales bacterium]
MDNGADERLPRGGGRIGESFPEVLAAARVGAAWAFACLFESLASTVTGYLKAQGATDADGLANDVFFRAFTRLDGFDGNEESFRSWVLTIAHHRLIDERRHISRRPVSEYLSPERAEGLSDASDSDELVGMEEASVRERLATLVSDQRDVLLLRILGDLTVEQVAHAVGKSVGAVKALQRRGLKTLRKKMSEERTPHGT